MKCYLYVCFRAGHWTLDIFFKPLMFYPYKNSIFLMRIKEKQT